MYVMLQSQLHPLLPELTTWSNTHQAEFFFAILDSIDEEIAVIHKNGLILFVNDAWIQFGKTNGLSNEDWLQSNYLDVCAIADKFGEPEVHEIYRGILSVVNGQTTSFSHDYPCHSPTEKRWFKMTVVNMVGYENQLFVITHSNITERKLFEEQVELLSLHDPLTGLSNRRHFESFINTEWNRNEREQTPVSLIIIDIDNFKALNDKHGHINGDNCIKAIASIVGNAARRSGDLAVRWGGEEFILILGNTTNQAAVEIANHIRLSVEQLRSNEYGNCSVSLGLTSIIPNNKDQNRLIKEADAALYFAKETGRNRLVNFNCISNMQAGF